VDDSRAVSVFRELLRIPTVSRTDASETDWSQFERFRAALAEAFPLVFATAERETVAEHTLVLRLAGAEPSEGAVVLMAHQDVVAPGELAAWRYGAFEAELTGEGAEATIWSRGAIDDKGSLVGLLVAAERTLAQGVRPRRDVWFVFGHDEETHGTGARAAAAHLAERGVAPQFVLDEGGAIVHGFLPGVTAPLAAVGLAEKGIASISLTVDEPGGHASTPPRISAIGRLARAIARMDARPFPSKLTATAKGMFRAAGTGGRGFLPWLYRNVSLTGPVLLRALRARPEGDAMTRTTRVATVISGGHAHNAIPERAVANVNVRVLPGDTVAGAVEYIRHAIDDPQVQVDLAEGSEPSPVSPTSGFGWETLVATLAETHPEAIPTPYTQNGATDSRFFTGISSAVYRFTPFDLSDGERAALHAVDERIRVDSWLAGVRWYEALLRRI